VEVQNVGRDRALGALVDAGLMVERAEAIGVDRQAVEYCATEIRLAVSNLIDSQALLRS
jgi:hypothetical protein